MHCEKQGQQLHDAQSRVKSAHFSPCPPSPRSLSRLLWQLLPRLCPQDEKKCVEKYRKLQGPGNRRRLQHQRCCVSEKKQLDIVAVLAFERFSQEFSKTNFKCVQVRDEEEAEAERAAESVCESTRAVGAAPDRGRGRKRGQELRGRKSDNIFSLKNNHD